MGTSFRSTLTTCTSIGRGAASAGLFERLTKIRKARTKAVATAIEGIRTLRLSRIVFSWPPIIVFVLVYHSFQVTAAYRHSDSKHSLLQFDWFILAVHIPSLAKSIRVRRPGSFEVRFRWLPQR